MEDILDFLQICYSNSKSTDSAKNSIGGKIQLKELIDNFAFS